MHDDAVIDDDLLVASSTCRIKGKILGDVVSFGETIRSSAEIDGAMLAFGRNVTIAGNVGHSLAAAGEHVFIDGEVLGSAYSCGSTIEVSSNATLRRDFYAYSRSFDFDGTVTRDLIVEVGEDIVFAGFVGGDAKLIAQTVYIRESAVVNGDLIIFCDEENIFIDDDADIRGEIVLRKPEKSTDDDPPLSLIIRAVLLLSVLLISLLVIPLSRAHFARSTEGICKDSLRAISFAIISYVAGVIVALVLLVTGVGALASLLVISVLGWFLMLVGQVYTVGAIGSLIIKRGAFSGLGLVAIQQIVGALVFSVFLAIPVVGWIIYILAGFLGLGGFIVGLNPRGSTGIADSSA